MRSIAGVITLAVGAAMAGSALPEEGRLVIGTIILVVGIAMVVTGWNDAKPKQ